MCKHYDITPNGNMSILMNDKESIQMITFGMKTKNLNGRLKGIKRNNNSYFKTYIEFKDKIVYTVSGIN